MGAVAAVRILHRRRLAEVPDRASAPQLEQRARRRARADRRRPRPGHRDRRRRRGHRADRDPAAIAVGLAGHQRHPRHDRLGERVQQLGAAAHDAVPLLADAGQVAGDVDEHDQRHAERVAHPHEPGRLLRRRRVQAAAEAQRVVRDDADGPAAEPAERRDDVGRPARVQLERRCRRRAARRPAAARRRRACATRAAAPPGRRRLDRRPRLALVAEQRGQPAGLAERALLGVGDDVHDAGAPAVRLRAAEAQRVDVLAGDRADDVRAGDEDPARPGRGSTMSVSAGPYAAPPAAGPSTTEICGTLPGGPHHDREDLADGVQASDALGQPRAAGVPDADDRARRSRERALVRVDDVPAAVRRPSRRP